MQQNKIAALRFNEIEKFQNESLVLDQFERPSKEIENEKIVRVGKYADSAILILWPNN